MTETVVPVINSLSQPFWSAAQEGRLALPRCTGTGRFFWPPAPISPFGGHPVVWENAEPVGVVVATAIYRRAFQQAFAALLPYGVALVELTCGPRLQVHVPQPDRTDAPKAGARVRLSFRPLVEGGPAVPMLDQPAPSPNADVE